VTLRRVSPDSANGTTLHNQGATAANRWPPTHKNQQGISMRHLACAFTRSAAAIALLATSIAAHAVVETGHWGYGPLTNGYNMLSVQQNTSGFSSFGVQTTYNAQAGTLTLGVPTAGAPASIFLMTPGQVIGRDNWLSLPGPLQTPFDPQTGSQSYFQAGKDFYLGTATIAIDDPEFNWATVSTTSTTFGWAHFQAQADGSLKLLDSAMAFREPGIRVGTLQAIPEPGTWALMGIGLVGLAAVARRRPR